MKKSVFILLTLFAVSLFAQEEQVSAEQKAWTEFMTPGSMHELLASTAGEWQTKTTWWMFPGAEPQISEGTVKTEMIFGGRYLKSEHTGNMMGMPMEGMAIEAYDNALQKFVSTWIDNFGTGISTAEGTYNPETKTLTYHGKGTDPVSKSEMKYKQEMFFESENKCVITMYNDFQGAEFKSMVIEYSR